MTNEKTTTDYFSMLQNLAQDYSSKQQMQMYPTQSAWQGMMGQLSGGMGLPYPTVKHIRFFRINNEIEIPEGGTFEEPLDELRLKVARWLRRN